MIAGPIAKKLSKAYKISPSYTASILDIYACIGRDDSLRGPAADGSVHCGGICGGYCAV